jgi:sugar (pentulose or hexulose) kinase
VQEASIFTSGAVLRWFRDQIGHAECNMVQEGQDPYDLITAEAKQSTIGAKGLLLIPHFIGAGAPHWNPHAKGIVFGLALGHERKDLYRAILEGVAYEIRKNIDVFKELGIEPNELMLTGGGSRSDFWNQICADVLGVTCVRNIIEEATSLGVAILAASGAGIFPDIAKAAETLCKVDKKWLPNNEHHELYEKYYRFSYDMYEMINSRNMYNKFDMLNQNKDFE